MRHNSDLEQTMTPEQIDEFLREPHLCDLATVRPDGSPHVAPVWHHYYDERLIILAEETAVKIRNIRHEPRVAASIATHSSPYKAAIVNGVAELSYSNIYEYVLAMATNYLGEEEGKTYTEKVVPETNFVVITITPTKIIGWNYDE